MIEHVHPCPSCPTRTYCAGDTVIGARGDCEIEKRVDSQHGFLAVGAPLLCEYCARKKVSPTPARRDFRIVPPGGPR